VFSLIGEEMEFSREITGIRYKYQPNRTTIRIEVWVSSPLPEQTITKGNNVPDLKDLKDEKQRIFYSIRKWLDDNIRATRELGIQSLQFNTTDHRKD